MPRPTLTEAQRQEVRRNIRKATAQLYAANGLAEITARNIAQAAGVSVGTLYTHYSSLTELMQSLWQEPVRRLLKEVEAEMQAQVNGLEKLHVLLNRYATFATDQRALYRGALLFVRPQSDKKPEKISLDEDPFFRLFSNTVSEAQQQGLIRTGDPKILTQTLWAGLHGAIALPLNIDRLALDPPEESIQYMMETLFEWLNP